VREHVPVQRVESGIVYVGRDDAFTQVVEDDDTSRAAKLPEGTLVQLCPGLAARPLEELERLEEEYAEVKRKPPFELSAAQREKILELAQDLPRLWHAETTRQSQRKEVLRLLIEDVTVTSVAEPWSIAVAIQWRTGTLSQHQAERPLPHPQTTSPEVVARIQALYQTSTDAQIAALLNAEGCRSGYGRPFTAESVAHIRLRQGIHKYSSGLKAPGSSVH
jgi:hypothetical protein